MQVVDKMYAENYSECFNCGEPGDWPDDLCDECLLEDAVLTERYSEDDDDEWGEDGWRDTEYY